MESFLNRKLYFTFFLIIVKTDGKSENLRRISFVVLQKLIITDKLNFHRILIIAFYIRDVIYKIF